MPTQEQFKQAIAKEVLAMGKRMTEIETLVGMMKQSILTVADLSQRMEEEAQGVSAIPDGYERPKEETTLANHIDVTPMFVNGDWAKLSSPTKMLEDTFIGLLSSFLSPGIPIPFKFKAVRRGPINVRLDLDKVVMHDWDKNVDRIDDVNLNVFPLCDKGLDPFVYLIRPGMPSGFYCFTQSDKIAASDIHLSLRSRHGIVIYSYNVFNNAGPILSIYGKIDQANINRKFVDEFMIDITNKLQELARYCLESPQSRKDRLFNYHLCAT